MSVSAAAALVGVGRPAFSNFLNGNAALTPVMAARIEVAFGATKEELLAMQSAFDAAEAQTKGAPADATPYAVPFLNFKARDIEDWAERNIGARNRLAVLIRTLVNSTGRGITKVDFPGNDDAERPGWDGIVDAGQGTPCSLSDLVELDSQVFNVLLDAIGEAYAVIGHGETRGSASTADGGLSSN